MEKSLHTTKNFSHYVVLRRRIRANIKNVVCGVKKFLIGALLGTAFCTKTLAALPTGTPPGRLCVPTFCGGFTMGLNLMYLQPSTSQLDYALFFPKFGGTTSFTSLPEDGSLQSAEPDSSFVLRINVGYIIPCSGNDVIGAYSSYSHRNDDIFINPFNAFNLFSTLSSGSGIFPFPPDFSSAAEISFFTPELAFGDTGVIEDLAIPIPIKSARARSEFNLQWFDLELAQYVNVGCRFRLRCYGGLRVADITSKLSVHYRGTGSDEDVFVGSPTTGAFVGEADVGVESTLHVDQETLFDGAGPRFGFRCSYHIGNGFGLIGESSAALLIGRAETTLKDELSFFVTAIGTEGIIEGVPVIDNTIEDNIIMRYPKDTRIVPNFEGKIALDYTYQVCYFNWAQVSVELGYVVNHFWNTIDRVTGAEVTRDLFNGNHINYQNAAANTRKVLDSSYSGPYFNVQLTL